VVYTVVSAAALRVNAAHAQDSTAVQRPREAPDEVVIRAKPISELRIEGEEE